MNATRLLIDWLGDPVPIIVTLAGVALAAVLYWRGARYARRTGIGRPVETLQAVAFAGGLVAIVVAIASPLDALADRSLAAHMAQHALLILVAAPLLLLGEPFWRIWRALPTAWRRESLRWLMRRRRVRQGWGALEALATRPVAVLVVFLLDFLLWHIPALYDLALEHEALHAVEHISFLLTALLFWGQVIPMFPLRPRLTYGQRAGYVFIAGLVLHFFSILIAVAHQPIYAYYGSGVAASADQDAAAAMMDVSGMVIFTIALMALLGLWLYYDEKSDEVEDAEPGVMRVGVADASVGGALLLMEADTPRSGSTDAATPDT